MDNEGNFRAVYYDSISPSHKSKIKFVNNGKRKVKKISSNQQNEIQNIVNRFIAGSSSYEDNGNEDIDHSLLVSCDTGLRPVNYYYWRNDEVIPKGVEELLKFVKKLSK